MANEQDIQIKINTQAETSGLEKGEAALKKLDAAADVAGNEVEQLAHVSLASLEKELADATEAFRKASIGSDDFKAAAVRLKNAKNDLSQVMDKTTAGGINMRSMFSNVGYQVQDMAVQVGMGTSAIRAFGQQAPQLLGSFGPWGIAAGAAIAVGAPLVEMLFNVGTNGKTAAENLEFLAEAAKKTATNMGELEQENLNTLKAALLSALEHTKALKQSWELTKQAEGQYAAAALTNAGKLAAAQRLVAEQLGKEVDTYKLLEAAAQREAQQRELAAQTAAAAQIAKKTAAEEELNSKEDLLGSEREALAQANASREAAVERLTRLREERAELEKIAAVRATFGQALTGEALYPGQNNQPKALAAQNELATAPRFTAELGGLEKRLDVLDKAILNMTDVGGSIDKLTINVDAAKTKLADTAAAVDIKLQEISDTTAMDNLKAKAQTVAAEDKLMADGLTTAMSQIQANSEKAKAAKETISAAVADGVLTQAETAAVNASMFTLIGEIRKGTATTTSSVQELLNIQRSFTAIQATQAGQITGLQNQINALSLRR